MRTDPPATGSERQTLEAYLDYQRQTVLDKAEGLPREELARIHPPSTLTLAGLLLHLALVEESWLEVRFAGLAEREPWIGVDWAADPDWEFHAAVEWDPEAVRQRYRDAIERSHAVCAGADSLDQLSAKTLRSGEQFSLRWVLLHLLEETARHAGHADLLREAVDGSMASRDRSRPEPVEGSMAGLGRELRRLLRADP